MTVLTKHNTTSSKTECASSQTPTFSYDRKKKIVSNIEQLKSKDDYIALFKIINKVTDKYTQNNNGVFINLNCLDDATLLKIEHFLETKKQCFKNNHVVNVNKQIDLLKSLSDNTHESIMKLTNYEKNIVKRHRTYRSDHSSESDFYTS